MFPDLLVLPSSTYNHDCAISPNITFTVMSSLYNLTLGLILVIEDIL